jgi:Flp pilus assembly CpaE family ATPase
VVRGLTAIPSPDNLVRFFQNSPARIVFLDIRVGGALELSGEMELRDPGLQFIAVGEPPDPIVPVRGIHERLALPLDGVQLKDAIARRIRVLEKLPHRLRKPTSFLSFLPAKTGAGTTTIACGLAHILSTDYKTLLCDFDLATGTIGFRHRLEGPHSLPEIAGGFENLDEHLWSQIVSRTGKLHILPSRLRPAARIRPDVLAQWFDLLRATYDVVIFDLSGQMEEYSFEIMNASRQIFLVTTQELECLHMGRAKTAVLRDAGLDQQACVLLNRFQKAHTLKRSDVEDLLELSVRAQFPNDYNGVQNAIRAGTQLKPGTALHRAIAAFAPFANNPSDRAVATHKFLEFVSLSALNYWRRPEARSERWT